MKPAPNPRYDAFLVELQNLGRQRAQLGPRQDRPILAKSRAKEPAARSVPLECPLPFACGDQHLDCARLLERAREQRERRHRIGCSGH